MEFLELYDRRIIDASACAFLLSNIFLILKGYYSCIDYYKSKDIPPPDLVKAMFSMNLFDLTKAFVPFVLIGRGRSSRLYKLLMILSTLSVLCFVLCFIGLFYLSV